VRRGAEPVEAEARRALEREAAAWQPRGEALLAALSRPFDLGDYELFVSASIGIAGYPLDGSDPVTLIANADAAMYAAKARGRMRVLRAAGEAEFA